jgi:DNA-directed RNA polymerase subunit K/omega
MVPRAADVNRFHFVVVSSLRAQQLLAGSTPRVEGEHNAVTIAQMEVAEGRVAPDEPEAAVTRAQCHWQL